MHPAFEFSLYFNSKRTARYTGRFVMYSGITKIYYRKMTYLDMLQNIPTFIFQQDGSPAHFHCEVRQYLNTVLPGRWIGGIDVCPVTRGAHIEHLWLSK
jgi:hypothetical protein